jgi:adenosine kinase
MRIAVSGSIAEDYLMTFPGKFADVIVPEQIHRLSLSFLVDELEIRRGGVAANICFGMAGLGLRPVLVGSVGRDFHVEYGPALAAHGVDVSHVLTSDTFHTARFLCTTDEEENQLASFYAGAMQEANAIDLAAVHAATGGIDLVVIAPNDPAGMLRHTRQARELGIPFAADPSQQLPRLGGDEVRDLLDGAAYLLCNDYEASLIESKTGWDGAEILRHVGIRVTTHGAEGCVIEQAGELAIRVAAVPPRAGATLEPTGVGDAFRAGFLAGRVHGLSMERCAQVGATVATYALESVGTQEYRIEPVAFLERLRAAYGDAAASEVSPVLDGVPSAR